jgi:hypothetical protein
MERVLAATKQNAFVPGSPEKRLLRGASVKAPENGHAGDGAPLKAAAARDAGGSPAPGRGADLRCPQGCKARPKCGRPAPKVRIAVVDGDRRVHCALRAAFDDPARRWMPAADSGSAGQALNFINYIYIGGTVKASGPGYWYSHVKATFSSNIVTAVPCRAVLGNPALPTTWSNSNW